MMTEEEILESLWDIANAVAISSDTVINDYDNYECPFCRETDNGSKSNFKVIHEDTCIVLKARALVAQKAQHE
jgi:protein-disulfide isomerase